MIRRVVVTLFVCAAGTASAQASDVSRELWDRPRTGQSVAAEESVRRAVIAALVQPEARIVIHHPPGQETELHAEELRSWLGALAIDTRRVDLRAAAAGTQLRIEVIP